MNAIIMLNAFASITTLTTKLVTQYIGPLAIIIIIGVSMKYLLQGMMRPFFAYLALAVLVLVIIYGGASLLSSSSTLIKNASSMAEQVN